MKDDLIPLNSDTETRPTEAMRRAIAEAEVGDEQQRRDPTVLRLEERVAERLGKEAALWLPTGTMCNLIAVRVHTRPGDAVVADWMAHVIRAESAGSAVASGVLIEPIRTERGIFTASALEEALERIVSVPEPYGQPVGLVCVEQTHNFGGGTVWSLDEMKAIAELARERGIAVHMDGARMANACVASAVEFSEFAAQVDSLWLDFTKGLGAPIGAVLAGTEEFVASARRMKQLFGGAMRQAGIAAAGCLYALEHHVERLADDHANARALAEGLAEIDGLRVKNHPPETNLVFFEVGDLGLSAADFLAAMAREGVRMSSAGGVIRAVTHLDVSRADVDRALEAVRAVAGQRR